MLVRTSPLMPISRMLNNDWHTLADWSHGKQKRSIMQRPAVNIQATDSAFLLSLAAPGLKKEDFQIEVKDDVLTIKTEHKEQSETTQENWTRREFRYDTFSRSFSLEDANVDISAIEATYEAGILHLTLPKQEEAEVDVVQRIEIK